MIENNSFLIGYYSELFITFARMDQVHVHAQCALHNAHASCGGVNQF